MKHCLGAYSVQLPPIKFIHIYDIHVSNYPNVQNCKQLLHHRNDYSYWLATNQSRGLDLSIPTDETLRYISRCSVCATSKTIIAIHNQTNVVPDCPESWTGLWSGYSYVSVWQTVCTLYYHIYMRHAHLQHMSQIQWTYARLSGSNIVLFNKHD